MKIADFDFHELFVVVPKISTNMTSVWKREGGTLRVVGFPEEALNSLKAEIVINSVAKKFKKKWPY